jgi:predicted anti-sigma-YlaC factor YlaD
MKCDALSDDLIEFALGTLAGRSRSRVLDHLDSCAHCDAELESLAGVVDTMLWLAPEAEPSLGFESRLIERYRESDTRRLTVRRRRASVLAVAAVLIALLGIGVDAVLTTHGNSTNPSVTARPTSGRLTADGIVVGHVTISSGSPSWMIMDVDAGRLSGVVWCEVTFANGRVATVGKFTLSNGYGSWIAPIKASGSNVRSARLVNARGTVLAQATFATSPSLRDRSDPFEPTTRSTG